MRERETRKEADLHLLLVGRLRRGQEEDLVAEQVSVLLIGQRSQPGQPHLRSQRPANQYPIGIHLKTKTSQRPGTRCERKASGTEKKN